MLTRCPQCQTMFRILPEHLKVRQGRVRCGRCRAEFNALETLIEDAPPPPIPPAVSAEPDVPGDPWLGPQEAPVPAQEPVVVEPAAPEPPPEEQDDSPATIPLEPIPDFEVAAEPAVAAAEPPPAADPVTEPGFATRAEAATSAPAPAHDPTPAPHRELPSPQRIDPDLAAARGPFTLIEEVQEAPPPPKRWPWVMLTLVALFALSVQAALHFRVELASRTPAVRPALAMLCDLLACTIPLPMDIAAIGIDTSDLHPDPAQADRLQLLAGLRNRSPYAQTWPHLELTLTDASDKVLLRRAVAPAEYLADRKLLAAGFAARGEQAIKLDLKVTELAPVGYRLYVFYP